jgi:protein ImuB
MKPNDFRKSVRGIISILHKWGVHSFGEFSRLDTEDIRGRLGPEAVRLWERAQGKSMRLLKAVEPPESFIESFEFEYEIETAEPLLFVLRRFLEQLQLRLTGIYLVAKALTLRIQFSNKQSYHRRFEIPDPTNSVELLFRMLQTHLEGFKSEHPITGVSLETEPAQALPQQFGLFEASLRNPTQLYETLARLTALLGNEFVGTPVLEDTHRPDAFHIEPFSWELPEPNEPVQANTKPALRRFRPNRSGSVTAVNQQPAQLRSSELTGPVAEKAGPYAASGNWWDEKYWRRQEWEVELQNGAVCRMHHDGHSWEIDGIYD